MSSDTPRSARSIDRLGPYTLVKRIAVGGTAEIHLGFRSGLGQFRKFYAIKLLHSGRRQRPEFEGLLADEAALVSQLDHPNIVAVHDFGRIDDVSYLVMDYVHGRDLRRILDLAIGSNVRFPDVISAWIASEVCEALGYAHSRTHPDGRSLALVHRDISPPNILLGFEGEVKVADFGVARSSVAGRSETKTGVIKGKLQYMPPEYAIGNLQDARGDIFSLGLVLFEMLTNRKAYSETDGIDQMVHAIKHGAVPDLRRIRPDLEPQLVQIVARSVAPRPAHRYQTADEMAADLKQYVSHKVPSFTRSRLRDVVRQLFDITGGQFPETNSLLGDTLQATGLDHLIEVTRNPAEDQIVHVGGDAVDTTDETVEGRLYVNAGSGSYPDDDHDDADDWAIAPTSTDIGGAGENAPGMQDDPNVPPPRILSPSGYVRDFDREQAGRPPSQNGNRANTGASNRAKSQPNSQNSNRANNRAPSQFGNQSGDQSGGRAANRAADESEFDPIEIPASSIEPLELDDVPTGRIEGRNLRDLADPTKD